MNDNDLIARLITTINAGLALHSVTLNVQQSYQPTTQGAPSVPTLYLAKIAETRYGFPTRSDVWDAGSATMVHTESEIYETTFQAAVLAIQNPSETGLLTAADYLKVVSSILQSDITVQSLLASGTGISIYRIQGTKQTYWIDDNDEYESSPILEFTVQHSDTWSTVNNSTTVITETLLIV